MEPQTSLDELVRTQTEQALRKFVREYLGENEELSMRLGEQLEKLGEGHKIVTLVNAAVQAEFEKAAAQNAALREKDKPKDVKEEKRLDAERRQAGIVSDESAPATFFPAAEAACLGFIQSNCGGLADLIVAPPGTLLGTSAQDNNAISVFTDEGRENLYASCLNYAEAHPEIKLNFKRLVERIRTSTLMVISYESGSSQSAFALKTLIHEYGHLQTGDARETFKVFAYEIGKIRDIYGDAEAADWVRARSSNRGILYYAETGILFGQEGLVDMNNHLQAILRPEEYQAWLRATKQQATAGSTTSGS